MQTDRKPSTSEIMYRAFPPHLVGLMVLQIAVVVVVIVAGCVLLGRFLDARFGTQPWLMLIGALVGSLTSVYATYRVGMRTVAKTRDAYEKWKQQTQPAANQDNEHQESSAHKTENNA